MTNLNVCHLIAKLPTLCFQIHHDQLTCDCSFIVAKAREGSWFIWTSKSWSKVCQGVSRCKLHSKCWKPKDVLLLLLLPARASHACQDPPCLFHPAQTSYVCWDQGSTLPLLHCLDITCMPGFTLPLLPVRTSHACWDPPCLFCPA